MKTIILYYSLGGTSRKKAEQLVKENENAALCEIKELRKRNIFTAFIPGCFHAAKRKTTAIKPLGYDLSDYDHVVIVCPIWASFPAPAFNSIAALLPAGKEVELYFCSGNGGEQQSEQGTKDIMIEKGCILIDYHNVKSSTVI